jgi:hypothetical protein
VFHVQASGDVTRNVWRPPAALGSRTVALSEYRHGPASCISNSRWLLTSTAPLRATGWSFDAIVSVTSDSPSPAFLES